MDIDEFIKKLEETINNIDTYLINTNETVAVTARSLVVNRIQQEGIAGRSYSDNKLSKSAYEGKALRASAYAELEAKGAMSYREWRIANGLQVDHVDLTYSGRMFQNLQVQGTTREGRDIITIIDVSQSEEQKKMNANAKRYGDFLEVTQAEEDLLALDFEDELISKINL